jgi:RNA 2',3'-cyclic 3'-phosphodiesterase
MSEIATTVEVFRLFIALPIPESVKDELARVQSDMRANLRSHNVKWTKPEQMHLTLRFLGNVPTNVVPELIDLVRASCQSFESLKLKAQGIGFFPNENRPRVIWVGVKDEQGKLGALQAAINSAVAPFSEKDEKRFNGHLTLGRAQAIRGKEIKILAELAQGMADRSFGEWTADRVELMRSELSPQGSHHTCLASVPLISRQAE